MKTGSKWPFWKKVLLRCQRPGIKIHKYVPSHRRPPTRGLHTVSAWKGIENILADIIERFEIPTQRCLEFGVEYGFSTVALSSFFSEVTGVDTFNGDEHTVYQEDIYQETVDRLAPYENIRLVRSDYRDYIAQDATMYDLVHVDIVHTYEDTFACGLWSANHSKCVIFHDTQSFATVKEAVLEIARVTGKTFYNFEESNGLGILI